MDETSFPIVATGTGNYEGTIEGTINIKVLQSTLTGTLDFGDITITSGTEQTHSGTINFSGLAEGTDYTLSISPIIQGMFINNGGIITIASDIAVSDGGTYTVKATGINNYTGSVSDEFVLTVEANISGKLSYQDIITTYGTQANKAPTWADVADTNQTLSYAFKSTNIPTGINIDTANGTVSVSNMASAMTAQAFTVVATGTGNYKSSIEGTINITVDRKALTGTLEYANVIVSPGYSGKTHTGTVEFTGLAKGTDYDLSIKPVPDSNGWSIDASGVITIPDGIAADSVVSCTVTATGKGNYTGTIEDTFDLTVKREVSGLSYSPASQDITVGTAMQVLTPTVEPSGATGTYTVNPGLPAGIGMNGGTISGKSNVGIRQANLHCNIYRKWRLRGRSHFRNLFRCYCSDV